VETPGRACNRLMQDVQKKVEAVKSIICETVRFTDRNLLQNRFYNFVISVENRENLSAMRREIYSSQLKRAQIQHH